MGVLSFLNKSSLSQLLSKSVQIPPPPYPPPYPLSLPLPLTTQHIASSGPLLTLIPQSQASQLWTDEYPEKILGSLLLECGSDVYFPVGHREGSVSRLNSCTPRITLATRWVGSKWGNLQDGRDSETRVRGHPVTRKNGWSKAAFESECGTSSPQKVFLKYASCYGAEKGISFLPFLLPLPSLPQLLFPFFTNGSHKDCSSLQEH